MSCCRYWKTSVMALQHAGNLCSISEAASSQHIMRVQWSPGGKGAHTILERFVSNGLQEFNAHRAKTDRESTSSLSPHVHYGEISTRHIFYVVRRSAPRYVYTLSLTDSRDAKCVEELAVKSWRGCPIDPENAQEACLSHCRSAVMDNCDLGLRTCHSSCLHGLQEHQWSGEVLLCR